MREIIICEINLLSVDVIDEVIEICTMDKYAGQTLLKIARAAWDDICERVIEEMKRGVSPGEGVE
ncbi:hypothetical protein ES703_124924 [subsurface metagenome]